MQEHAQCVFEVLDAKMLLGHGEDIRLLLDHAGMTSVPSLASLRVSLPATISEAVASKPLFDPARDWWHPAAAVALITTAAAWPRWRAATALALPVEAPVRYCYAVFRGGEFYRWEGMTAADSAAAAGGDGDHAMGGTADAPEGVARPLFVRTAIASATQPHEVASFNDTLAVFSNPPGGSPKAGSTPRVTFSASGSTLDGGSDTALSQRSFGSSQASLTGLGAVASPARNRARRDDHPTPAPGGGSGTGGPSSMARTKSWAVLFGAKTPPLLGTGAQGAEEEEPSVDARDAVVVVAYELPVVVSERPDPRDPSGRTHAAHEYDVTFDEQHLLSMPARGVRVTRVGTCGAVRRCDGSRSEPRPDEEGAITAALRAMECVAVWLGPELVHEYRNGFCHGFLRPRMHQSANIFEDDLTKNTGNKKQFDAYVASNRLFADAVVGVIHERDLVWVHDYYLLLVPQLLARKVTGSSTRIGLWLHTPFPSSEIFRTIPQRTELLRGMLAADAIGFHLYEFARHFITCCRRLLGLECAVHHETGQMCVAVSGRRVAITCVHAGADLVKLRGWLRAPSVSAATASLRAASDGRYIVAGVDELIQLKGIVLKLLAFERFLEDNPGAADRVCLVQLGLVPRDRETGFNTTRAQVESMVARISAKFGGACVRFIQAHADDASHARDRLALLSAADVYFLTPVREGLNLTPLEFVLAHEDRRLASCGALDALVGGGSSSVKPPRPPPVHERRAGVLVLSEMVGCARVLAGGMRINPWDVVSASQALATALFEMTDADRTARHAQNMEWVARTTATAWANAALTDLKKVPKSADSREYVRAGLGFGAQMFGMSTGFNQLDVADVARSYRAARRRVIFCDFGGTLVEEHERHATGAAHLRHLRTAAVAPRAPSAVRATLAALTADVRNAVYIVSGKTPNALSAALGGTARLGLASEHGYYRWWPGATQWEAASPAGSIAEQLPWKALTRSILQTWVERVNGTYIEEKASGLIWHYRDGDPEFSVMMARELEDHLLEVFEENEALYQVDVLRSTRTEKYVEVRPRGVDKGVFVTSVMHRMLERDAPADFALCIGDDLTDEAMFSALEAYQDGAGSCTDVGLELFTATVGKKPTKAIAYLDGTEDVRSLLLGLTRVSARAPRSASCHNFAASLSPRPPTAVSPRPLREAEDASGMSPPIAIGAGPTLPADVASAGRPFGSPGWGGAARTAAGFPSSDGAGGDGGARAGPPKSPTFLDAADEAEARAGGPNRPFASAAQHQSMSALSGRRFFDAPRPVAAAAANSPEGAEDDGAGGGGDGPAPKRRKSKEPRFGFQSFLANLGPFDDDVGGGSGSDADSDDGMFF